MRGPRRPRVVSRPAPRAARAARKHRAKVFNERRKELAAYVRGIAISVVVFGVVRVAFDPSAFRSYVLLAAALLASGLFNRSHTIFWAR